MEKTSESLLPYVIYTSLQVYKLSERSEKLRELKQTLPSISDREHSHVWRHLLVNYGINKSAINGKLNERLNINKGPN